eukprot:798441-Pyramimonas_sp.AAC.1
MMSSEKLGQSPILSSVPWSARKPVTVFSRAPSSAAKHGNWQRAPLPLEQLERAEARGIEGDGRRRAPQSRPLLDD